MDGFPAPMPTSLPFKGGKVAIAYQWINVPLTGVLPIGVSVDLLVGSDPQTCTLTYQGFVPGRNSLMALAFGIRFNYSVIPLAPVVQRCEQPPDTCKKRLTITVVLSLFPVYFGFELFRWRVTHTVHLDTSCLPQCCS
jgi:hypothetical protein